MRYGDRQRHPLSGDHCLHCGSDRDVDYSTYFGRTICSVCHTAAVDRIRELEAATLPIDGQALQQGLAL